MGACGFVQVVDAASARQGFEILSDNARAMYGYDAYNGTISTTRFRGVAEKVADKWTKTSEKKALKLADELLDRCPKWECRAIDCGVVEYRITTLKKNTSHTATAAKYQTRFVLHDALEKRIGSKSYATQAEAKTALLNLFKEGKIDQGAFIVKEPVLVSGDPKVSAFYTAVKTSKSRPKSVPADAIVEEIHRFVLCGVAAC